MKYIHFSTYAPYTPPTTGMWSQQFLTYSSTFHFAIVRYFLRPSYSSHARTNMLYVRDNDNEDKLSDTNKCEIICRTHVRWRYYRQRCGKRPNIVVQVNVSMAIDYGRGVENFSKRYSLYFDRMLRCFLNYNIMKIFCDQSIQLLFSIHFIGKLETRFI